MRRNGKWVGLCALVVLSIGAGCATGNVKFGEAPVEADLSGYTTVAIVVLNDIGTQCPAEVPENLQAAAINQMQTKYPEAFTDVRPSPTNSADELLVEVHIVKYKEGSRFARAMLVGLGSSKLNTDVNMLDSASKEVLGTGSLELVWAVGGALGASKGIEDLVNDAGTKIANAIIDFKEGRQETSTPGRTRR